MANQYFLQYGLLFASAGDAATAQAANGGSIVLAMSPESALAFAASLALPVTFISYGPAGGDAGNPITNTGGVPGFSDLDWANIHVTIGTGTPTARNNPRYLSTGPVTQSSVTTSYDGLGNVIGTTTSVFTWTGVIISSSPPLAAAPANPGQPALPTGRFDQAIVQFTGDGATGRAIAVPFDCSVGKVTIIIAAASGIQGVCYRSNDPAMSGTLVCGFGAGSIDTTHGIMTFTGTGFTVTVGSSAGVGFANTNLIKYTAIVMRDTTSDNRYLSIGRYNGLGAFSKAVAAGSIGGTSSPVTGVGFTADMDGFTANDTSFGTGLYTFFFLTATTGTIVPGYRGNSTQAAGFTLTFNISPRQIGARGVDTWVWGRGTAVRTAEMVGDAAVCMDNAAEPLTGLMTGPATVLTNNNVNNNGSEYDFASLAIDQLFINNALFKTFTGVGTASPPFVVALGFAPGAVFVRNFNAGAGGGVWRGPDHVGTDSSFMSSAGGSIDIPATGISAFGASSASMSTTPAPNGGTFYGWAHKSGNNGFALPSVPVGAAVLASSLPPTPGGGDGSIAVIGGGPFLPSIFVAASQGELDMIFAEQRFIIPHENIVVAGAAAGFASIQIGGAHPDESIGSAIITLEGDPIRWLVSGENPTATDGHLLSGGSIVIAGLVNIRNFKCILATASVTSKITGEFARP